jgi:hypothetical protein
VEPGVFIAMMIGAIPAVILFFYMLGPFEGLFDENSVFFSFVIGMSVGVVVGVIHVVVDPWALQNYFTSLLIFVIGFAVFDTFLRVVLFNSTKFSLKMETTFYCTAFSLGYGAMLAALWFYRSFTHPTAEVNAWVIIAYIAASFAFAVVYGSTGMLLGFGAYEGFIWRLAFMSVMTGNFMTPWEASRSMPISTRNEPSFGVRKLASRIPPDSPHLSRSGAFTAEEMVHPCGSFHLRLRIGAQWTL